MPYKPQQWEEDQREYERYESVCNHGEPLGECSKCDDMDIDRCLNCGRYRSSKQLDEDQVCKKPCVNPNEY